MKNRLSEKTDRYIQFICRQYFLQNVWNEFTGHARRSRLTSYVTSELEITLKDKENQHIHPNKRMKIDKIENTKPLEI